MRGLGAALDAVAGAAMPGAGGASRPGLGRSSSGLSDASSSAADGDSPQPSGRSDGSARIRRREQGFLIGVAG